LIHDSRIATNGGRWFYSVSLKIQRRTWYSTGTLLQLVPMERVCLNGGGGDLDLSTMMVLRATHHCVDPRIESFFKRVLYSHHTSDHNEGPRFPLGSCESCKSHFWNSIEKEKLRVLDIRFAERFGRIGGLMRQLVKEVCVGANAIMIEE
jgi:hypothetical protein